MGASDHHTASHSWRHDGFDTWAGHLRNVTSPASVGTIGPRHTEDTDQDSDSLSLEIFKTKQMDPFPSEYKSVGFGILQLGLTSW